MQRILSITFGIDSLYVVSARCGSGKIEVNHQKFNPAAPYQREYFALFLK